MRSFLLASISGAVLCTLTITAFGKATITTFDPAGSADTQPLSINKTGVITGWYTDSSNGVDHGFIRAPDGTIVTFDVSGGVGNTYALSINKGGAIAGQYAYQKISTFLRASDGTITTFDVPGATGTFGQSINEKDHITGWYQDSEGAYHGFLRSSKGTRTFDVSGAIGTFPYAISLYGVTGWYFDQYNHAHGFLRTGDGTITTFDGPGGYGTEAYAINDTGSITGWYFDSNGFFNGFVRAPDGTMTTFDGPGGDTLGLSISNKGAVTGQYGNGTSHAYLRSPDGNFKSFDPPNSQGTIGYSINSAGSVTGNYYPTNSFQSHGFVRVR